MSRRKIWFLRKMVRFVIIAFLVLTICFILPRFMPGDPIENLLGETVTYVDPGVRAALEAKYGLDRPILDQYGIYLGSVLSQDYGYSISKSAPVTDLIEKRLVRTAMLVLPAIIIGSLGALALATYCGMHRGGKLDGFTSLVAMFLQTVPGFLIAMLFVLIFSFTLDWFPLGNLKSGGQEGLGDLLDISYHLALPVTVLALLGGSSKFLVLRNSVTQVEEDYFIFVARSKGLKERQVATRHVMRNVMPSFLSILALNVGFMVSGVLLIEMVFSINGMGLLIYEGVLARDYPLLQGCFMVLTVLVLSMNLVAELLYGLADPRIGDATEKEMAN